MMPFHGVEKMTSSVAASSSSSQDFVLASCALVFRRIQDALVNDSVLILHRIQWRCLAQTYSEVLQALTHLLPHACPLLVPAKLIALLHALRCAMQDAETRMEECTARRSTFSHSWLVDKALNLGTSVDVVHVHLHNFLWAFSAALDHANLPIETLESDILLLSRTLSDIWAREDANADLSEACSFLNTIKAEEEGETSLLADFMMHKLSHAQDLESVSCDALPSYLWIDSGSLVRNGEPLGEGGYCKVHEAGWLGGRFAVKDFFYVESSIGFGREAAIQARLRHPNVTSLICCVENPSLHKCSLVMERMRQDLRALMIEKIEIGMDPPFSLGVAVDLMLQIAQGLEYLHSLHIMHRDLKSSNILVNFSRRKFDADVDDVGSCARLKIADFGMSKAKHGSSKYTSKQVGTTPWRAPEVFEINPEDEVEGDINAKYTKRADVYSFGVVCYEILTGKFPFEGTQVRKRVLAGERPLLPSYCPRALSSYIEMCWCAEPSRRPPFSQICRMLRYFKSCLFLEDQHDQIQEHHSWLLCPLSPGVCAHIDDVVISFVRPMETPLQPQPINILLEMLCCGVVLKEKFEMESAPNRHSHVSTSISLTQASVESSRSPQNYRSADELQQNGSGHCRSSSTNKSFSTYVFRLLKKLLHIQSTQHIKPKLQDALGLVRDFALDELRLATADFSKVVGKGGRGKVYYGKLGDGREIAVKTALHPNKPPRGCIVSTSDSMGLMQELRIASQLRHRNVVPLFGWCQVRGKLLLVYEFMPNGSLERHIFGKQRRLNWRQTCKVIYQVASALKYLHQDSGYLQIVHRDVKPSNVLPDSGWNARLGDCGSAILLRNGDASWQNLAGTPGYIAPECLTQGIVSPASDVYAFGITVLEIVAGRRAYIDGPTGETDFVRDWVWKLHQLGDLSKVADARLAREFDEAEKSRLVLLGLSCTRAEPYMRPAVEEVLRMLSGTSDSRPLPSLQTAQFDSSSGTYSCTLASTLTGSSGSGTMSKHISFDGNEGIEDELQQISSMRVFTFKELKAATRNFWSGNRVGEGGFGTVYKCSIDEIGSKVPKVIIVAVKRLGHHSCQGHNEWLMEVKILSQFDHPHLVKLIGYCCEGQHRLLIYEFMPNGSLDMHLFDKVLPPLSWGKRMRIALSAARGLAFLHGAERPIIFRDFKTHNILLDSDFTAKLSDFGLAKEGPMGDETHVVTRVMGTYGYAAPEYVATGHLTWRCDVYGFGVVLLELLTGRKVVETQVEQKQANLVGWALPYLLDKEQFLQIMDSRLGRIYSVKGAQKVAVLAYHCVSEDPKARPAVSEAVQVLESVQDMRDVQVHVKHTK